MEGSVEEAGDDRGKQSVSTGFTCRRCSHLSADPQGSQLDLAEVCLFARGKGTGDEVRGQTGRSVRKGGEEEPKLHSCELCGFSSRYANHVKRHMKTHNGEKPYRCPLCSYASAQLVNLQRHVRVHTGEKPYECPLCTFACSSLGNLKRHQRLHSVGRPGRRADSSQEGRVDDQRAAHKPPSTQGTAVPNMAEQVNGDARSLQSNSDETSGHESGEGVEEARYGANGPPRLLFACRMCGRDPGDGGSTRGQLCARCTLDALSGELPSCLEDASGGEKAYPCALCPFVTHYPNHLARHMKTHSGEKPYRCPECDYASAHFDNLKRHHRVHTGEKPYCCHLCDYACGNLANLRRHQRVHSGAKPFRCTVCGYSCNQSMNLKRHMLRHTGRKPFGCRECPYATGHWDNYKRHQKKHGHSADGWVKGCSPTGNEEAAQPRRLGQPRKRVETHVK